MTPLVIDVGGLCTTLAVRGALFVLPRSVLRWSRGGCPIPPFATVGPVVIVATIVAIAFFVALGKGLNEVRW